MCKAGIDADDQTGPGKHGGDLRQTQRRWHDSSGEYCGDTLGTLPLDRVAGRQNQRQPALAKRLAQFAPAPFIPQLVVATGRRQQNPQTIAT
ncbi:MAG: hypothetical protein AW09_000245 [Candidatus Accumulibacter phosphatis]|uniref:Uncharacterized protein n=1 Tax=Candidatus Accumulibacter phosphatis TaxID=327160 RepID=A0A080LZZ3_9PROT|nr:MAG: hypothetical protein AW09_000245 [Candidatus Accumulibacter phosphatis]